MSATELAPLARLAFAHGWARSGGPLTDRVKAGCVVAVTLACERPDAPDVLEATLQLGALEGTWAAIYDRRERLTAAHVVKVTKAYRALLANLDAAAAIKALQAAIPATEAAQPDPHRAEIEAAATAEARRLLHTVTDDTSSPEYRAAVRAIADALLDGEAEGVAGGVALIVRTTATVGVDFDLAFTDAHAALGRLDDHWGDAQGWLGRVIDGNATDLGNALSSAASAGGDYEALRDAAASVLDGEEIRSVETLIDLAMSQSFSNGALAIYSREGVTSVDFVTAGGARVCPICVNAESGNPWSLLECPRPGLHPYCVIGSTRVVSPSAISLATIREYVGDVCTIRTAAGYELTGTPNHPVATRGGWVPMAEIGVGDYVLSSTRPEWEISPVHPDVNNVPPTIEQVAEAFPVGFAPMPVSAEDFHGDGTGSDVYVVRTDRFLMDDGKPTSAEHYGQIEFGSGYVVSDPSLMGPRAGVQRLDPVGSPSPGDVGSAGESGALGGLCARHASEHGGAAATGLDARLGQPAVQYGAADAEGFCQGLEALTSDVTPDQVVHVDRQAFSGHVYNLDTVGGWYIGNGIVTHNCRCCVSPSSAPVLGVGANIARYLVA